MWIRLLVLPMIWKNVMKKIYKLTVSLFKPIIEVLESRWLLLNHVMSRKLVISRGIIMFDNLLIALISLTTGNTVHTSCSPRILDVSFTRGIGISCSIIIYSTINLIECYKIWMRLLHLALLSSFWSTISIFRRCEILRRMNILTSRACHYTVLVHISIIMAQLTHLGICWRYNTLTLRIRIYCAVIALNHKIVPSDSEVNKALFVFGSFLLIG